MMSSVTESVRRLDDRYREVVLLRFYEDLKPGEIAKRLGLPVETVRTRTRRALSQLASELDKQVQEPATGGKSRRLWALSLIPFCQRPSLAEQLTTRVSLATSRAPTSSLLGAGIAASLVVAALVWAVLSLSNPKADETTKNHSTTSS
ncbi:MAG: sigma-70 family RNA polymerase sigma factor [Planctomycetota bacterium]